MKGKILFRTAVMGFDKKDVITYIDRLTEQQNRARRDEEDKQREDLNKIEQLKNMVEQLKQQNFSLRAQLEEQEELAANAASSKTALAELYYTEADPVVEQVQGETKAEANDQLLAELQSIRHMQELMLEKIEGLAQLQESAKEENLADNQAAQDLKNWSDQIKTDLEDYMGQVQKDLGVVHVRIKNSKSSAQRSMDNLEKDLNEFADSIYGLDNVLSDVIANLVHGLDSDRTAQ